MPRLRNDCRWTTFDEWVKMTEKGLLAYRALLSAVVILML